MPISFFHGFEALQPTSVSNYSDQMRSLLRYIGDQEKTHSADQLGHPQVTLCVKTEFARSKSVEALRIRVTNNPTAPEFQLKEEDVRKRWSLTYREMTAQCCLRYEDFKTNSKFLALKRKFEAAGDKYSRCRFLDPKSPNSGSKTFYSPEVFNLLDGHYSRRSA